MTIRAAVLIPVRTVPGVGLVMTMIRRSDGGTHAGQMAFPGGRFEDGIDGSLLATAVRETYEEVGIAPSDIEMVGALPERRTYSSAYVVSPFVGRIPHPYEFAAEVREVDRIIDAPIEAFRERAKRRFVPWQYQGKAVEAPAVEVEGELVWGLSLNIIEDLLASDLAGRL